MKKIIILIAAITLISCESGKTEATGPWSNACHKPIDIPDTLYDGTEVLWDCAWHSSYVNHDIRVIKDSLGRVTAIARHLN